MLPVAVGLVQRERRGYLTISSLLKLFYTSLASSGHSEYASSVIMESHNSLLIIFSLLLLKLRYDIN